MTRIERKGLFSKRLVSCEVAKLETHAEVQFGMRLANPKLLGGRKDSFPPEPGPVAGLRLPFGELVM